MMNQLTGALIASTRESGGPELMRQRLAVTDAG